MKNYVVIINNENGLNIIEGAEAEIFDHINDRYPLNQVDSMDGVRLLLLKYQPPSGVYGSVKEAEKAATTLQALQDARLMKVARKKLDMTQLELTNAMGFSNPQQDGLPIRRIESAKVSLSGVSKRLLAGLIAGKVITDKNEEKLALESVNNGKWKDVGMGEFRRYMYGEEAQVFESANDFWREVARIEGARFHGIDIYGGAEFFRNGNSYTITKEQGLDILAKHS